MYKFKGINSDVETCQQCGKTGLKRVIWFDRLDEEGNETGNVIAMGTTCGAKAMGFKGKFETLEQLRDAVVSQEKLVKIRLSAQLLANEYQDEVGILKRRNGEWSTVRGKAYDVDPSRYGCPSEWVKPF